MNSFQDKLGSLSSINEQDAQPKATNEASTDADIFKSLAKMVQDIGGISAENVTPESRFSEDLAISSLNLIELIVTVEDHFGVRIEDNDAKHFKTVQDVLDFVQSHQAS
ncbi:acyl carrier protein [Corynebacterium callunae]|uniref:acyl carrier protein n=1 Tax=Corynebacterium callunae TaxID=1721 RepID=UPI0039821B1C